MCLNLLKADTAPGLEERGIVARAEKQGTAGAMEKQGMAVAKGKQPTPLPKRTKHTHGSSEGNEPEASNLALLPLISLTALKKLALESGRLSATNTAADSPATCATLPKLRLPKHLSPTSLTAPEGSPSMQSSSSKSFYQLLVPAPAQDSAGFTVKVSAPLQKLLKPGKHLHAYYSSTNVSPTSYSRSITARVAMLERKIESYERSQKSLEEWKQDIEKRLKVLGA